MKISRLPLTGLVIASAWMAVMFGHLIQGQSQSTDLAWVVKLMVKNVTEVVLWTAAWSWVTFVLQYQTRLALHVCIVAAACLIDEAILKLAMPWLFYAQGWSWPEGLNKLCWIVLLVFTALLQMRVAKGHLSARLLLLWFLASTLAVSLFSAQIWAEHNDPEAIKRLPYDANFYPPLWLSRPSHSLDLGLEELWSKEWER
jgi:hypothetical protein